MNSIRAAVIEANHTLPKITPRLNLETKDAAGGEMLLRYDNEPARCLTLPRTISVLQMFSSDATGVKNCVMERSDCGRLFFRGGNNHPWHLLSGGPVAKALLSRASQHSDAAKPDNPVLKRNQEHCQAVFSMTA